MTNDQTNGPAGVTGSNQPKQAGDIHLRWEWVEQAVWTERMLTRLEQSEPKTVWYGLWDKVISERNLQAAFWAVWRNAGAPGVDGQTVRQFEAQEAAELAKLREELRDKRYHRQAARRAWIPKAGTKEKRPLGIPAVRDRTVEAALKQVLEPIFEREFAEHSYGFRPEHSAQQAVARVEALLAAGYVWIVDADIQGCFDNIPQEPMTQRVAERVSDRRLLGLIGKSLRAGVMEEMKGWQPTEQGTPQGSVLSTLLANIYLNPLDHQMARAGYHMTRYADDFVIQCQSRAEAEAALAQVRVWMSEAGLKLHPEKTRIVDGTQRGGFEFLGWHFERGYQWPREKSQTKLKETIRRHTPRTSGKSLREIVGQLNRSLQGWRAYFDHGAQSAHEALDQMVRRRLRQLLLKRRGKRGKPTGQINQRWPNAYFDKLGLWRLAGAPMKPSITGHC